MRFQKIFSRVSPVSVVQPPEQIPHWLWYGAWGALFTIACGGLLLAVLLRNGAADPPRAGPLVWQRGPLPTLHVSPNYTTVETDTIPLFRVPYTLEIAGRFSADTDPAAAWGITFDQSSDQSDAPPFEIAIIGQRFFAVLPASPDSLPFIHIRPLGAVNRLRLDVDSAGQGILRINDEVAWRGLVPAARSARITLRSRKAPANLDVERVAVYAPDAPTR